MPVPNQRIAMTVLHFPKFPGHRPMRIASLFAAMAAIAFSPTSTRAQRDQTATWRIDYYDNDSRVQLQLDIREANGRSSNGGSVDLSSLAGLSAGQLRGSPTDAHFQLKRDAGTFTFDGRVGNNRGAGQFAFTPDPRFASGLAARGYSRPDDEEQFQLALYDIGFSYLDELKSQGYVRPSIDDLVTMGQHGVHSDYLRGMGQLGYHLRSTHDLVNLRDHGVTPAYVSGIRDVGYHDLGADDFVELRDHGVTRDYIAALANLGYTKLTTDDLLTARDHGVAASFADAFRKLGYTSISLNQLVRLRDHGVTPEFAARARGRDGAAASIQELISRRDRGDQ
jgi:hypothetical protein